MEIREQRQAAPVEELVGALVAVTRPIIAGVFQSIGNEYLSAYGGDRSRVPLKMLGRLRKEGDGDCGIAFEYAIHEAVRSGTPVVVERITDALRLCNIHQGDLT